VDDVDELATEKPADELLNIADGLSLVDYNEVVDDDTAEGFRPASADVLKTGSTTKQVYNAYRTSKPADRYLSKQTMKLICNHLKLLQFSMVTQFRYWRREKSSWKKELETEINIKLEGKDGKRDKPIWSKAEKR
jgi:hypothetical protein